MRGEASLEASPAEGKAGRADGDLLDRFHLGDGSAFEELVERFQRPVYHLAYRMVKNSSDAEEIAQEVFVRAYRSLQQFRRASTLKTWLFRIAINLSIDRKRRASPPVPSFPGPAQNDDDALALIERRGLEADLQEAIAMLAPRQRATLVLRVFYELSFSEIAEVVGSPLGTVKANYHHAVARLRSLLKAR